MTHIDWSLDSQYIQSNSGDYEHLFCMLDDRINTCIYTPLCFYLPRAVEQCAIEFLLGTAATCKQVTSNVTMRDVKWATAYCPLAYNTFGTAFFINHNH